MEVWIDKNGLQKGKERSVQKKADLAALVCTILIRSNSTKTLRDVINF